ncbi:MAG: hypothetical protein ACQESR_02410 [Planctomycetota bacterium]
MTRTIWPAVAILVTGFVCGCGGKEDASPKTTGQADASSRGASSASPREPNAADQQHAAFESSTPKEAVSEFLRALQSGDKDTTEALLTTKARQETEAHGLVVGPPGAPGATYTIGQVEPVEGDENSAYVSCVWSEKEAEAEFEVVWILRKEEAGWRVAGMATRMGDSDQPVVLNFENLSELEQTMREAEMAKQQPNHTMENNPAEKKKNTAAKPQGQRDPAMR